MNPARDFKATGFCVQGQCSGAVRCMRHASLYARHVMERQGWVCIDEYGTAAAVAVDVVFLDVLRAVQVAGVTLQKWMAGWDEKRGVPIMGLWAPRVVAAIVGTVAGKVTSDQLAVALTKAKADSTFAVAVDAAYRLGGHAAALDVLQANLPSLASLFNSSIDLANPGA